MFKGLSECAISIKNLGSKSRNSMYKHFAHLFKDNSYTLIKVCCGLPANVIQFQVTSPYVHRKLLEYQNSFKKLTRG